MKNWDLQGLDSPPEGQIDVLHQDLDSGMLLRWQKDMLLIRAVERRLALARKDMLIGGPVHLSIGQEAVPVAITESLRKTDLIFGAHRSHGHVLALGCNLKKFFAEILGKDDGLSRGMGGSMHLQDRQNGFVGSVPIVAGTVSLAAGAAMAAKFDKAGSVSVAYLGDGAFEEGVVHETLNLASNNSLPLIFVVENNLYASHMHISTRQTQQSICRFADANGMKHCLVDGNDVTAIWKESKKIIQSARERNQPALIEAVTYRWLGHVDWREDIDVGVSRSKEEVRRWRNQDPIDRLSNLLLKRKLISNLEIKELNSYIDQEVEAAWEYADQAPFPANDSLLGRVYPKDGN